MDIDTLKNKIRETKLHPIQIEPSALEGDKSNRFVGSLDEYLEAVSALGSKVVLIRTMVFEEDIFEHEPQHEDDPHQFSGEEVDLREKEPRLKAFEKHLGEIGMYVLSSELGVESLVFVIKEDWLTKFEKEAWVVAERVDKEFDDEFAKMRLDREQRESGAMAELESLVGDPKFIKQGTQIRMMAYAMEKIPALEDLDEMDVKAVIRRLHAVVKMRES